MATHSSILAWRIPGTAEPAGLPSTESQRRTRLKRLSSSSSSVAYTVLQDNRNKLGSCYSFLEDYLARCDSVTFKGPTYCYLRLKGEHCP